MTNDLLDHLCLKCLCEMRNRIILERRQAGTSYVELARQFEISPSRAHQICRRAAEPHIYDATEKTRVRKILRQSRWENR